MCKNLIPASASMGTIARVCPGTSVILAATVFSPLLGGWRNVVFVYGAVAILFGLFWWSSQEKAKDSGRQKNQLIAFQEALGHVMRIPNVWILCAATAGVSGGVNGMLGYLPLYLRDLGWQPAIADSTLAIAAMPIAPVITQTSVMGSMIVGISVK